MFRNFISFFALVGLVGCGHYVSPLDLTAKADKQKIAYNPAFEPKGDAKIKSGDSNRGATSMRGIASYSQDSYYGTDNNFVATSQAIFSQYGSYVSAMYATTVDLQQFYNYFTTQYWPSYYGGNQSASFWGGYNPYNPTDITFTMTTNAPAHYRIDLDVLGYLTNPGGPNSQVIKWDKNGTTLTARVRAIPGSAVTFTAALGVMSTAGANPTLNISATVTPPGGTASTATRDLSSLVAKDSSYGYGYAGSLKRDTLIAGQARLTTVGTAKGDSNPYYCYNSWYCFAYAE